MWQLTYRQPVWLKTVGGLVRHATLRINHPYHFTFGMSKEHLLQLQRDTQRLTQQVAGLYDTSNPATYDQFQHNWVTLRTGFEKLDVLGSEVAKRVNLREAQQIASQLTPQDFVTRQDEVWAVATRIGEALMGIINPLRKSISQQLGG